MNPRKWRVERLGNRMWAAIDPACIHWCAINCRCLITPTWATAIQHAHTETFLQPKEVCS